MGNDRITFEGIIIGILIGIPIAYIIFKCINILQTQRIYVSPTYENLEEWEVIKDERGRTRGIRVYRTAKES